MKFWWLSLATVWYSYVYGTPDIGSHVDTLTKKETSCPCGLYNEKQTRIINGKETPANKYPFMLALVLSDSLQHFCGGSILTQMHAVTAAHCTHELGDRRISVLAGAHDKRNLTEGAVIVPVKKYIEHEYFTPLVIYNDISILILERPLKFGPTISPICLANKKLQLENKDVKIIGWGKTGANDPTSDVLMEVDVKILAYIKCKVKFPLMYSPLPWKDNQICTGAKGRGACQGDSGGPVIYLDPELDRYVLVGLVSFGGVPCDPDEPTVETDATYFVPWIEKNIESDYCHKT